jgi:C-terminal processing protease CtpA/Prc
MRNSRWLVGLARTLAVVGMLGFGSTLAWAEEESDTESGQNKATQTREDDSSESSDDSSDRSSNRAESRDEDDSDSSDRDMERRQDRRQNTRQREEDRTRDDRSDDDDRDSTEQYRRQQESRMNRQRGSQQARDEYQSDRTQRFESSRNDQRSSSNQQQELGVEFETDDEDRLTVSSIEDDSIAARARLLEDDVIISVDGRRFTDSRQLSRYLQNAGSRRVPIIIERDGTRYTVQLQNSQREMYGQSSSQNDAWLGVYLDDNEDGAVITRVYPQGPADRAGLRPGDVVVQFNNQDVTDSEELVEWIEQENPNSRARFTVLRDDREFQISATLGDRNQYVSRGQNPDQMRNQQQQYSRDQYGQYTQRQDRQSRDFQEDNWQNQDSRNQNREFVEYQQTQRDNRGYSSYNYPGRGQQVQENRQSGDQIQRLERMIRDLQEEVRDLRDQVEDR